MDTSADSVDKVDKFWLTVRTLEQIFGLQIPKNIDEKTIRRIFTIAARDQFHKVSDSPDVMSLIKTVGARIPTAVGPSKTLNCYGVLYDGNHVVCTACGVREACRIEASNYDLDTISIGAQLLGTRAIRTAVVTGHSFSPVTIHTEIVESKTKILSALTPRDEEIVAYLRETLTAIAYHTNEFYFRHKEKLAKTKFIFWCGVGEDGRLRLRFCKPATKLRGHLLANRNGYYLSPDMSPEEAIKLIDKHTTDTFV